MGLETLPDVFNAMIERKISELHTCLPGRIVEYDYKTQKASVKPMIKKSYVDGETESLPIIVNVPVVWPRASKCSLTFPLQQDDYVLLVFSERSMELFLTQGGEQEPGDRRKLDLTDAIAVPGVYPFSEDSLADNNEDVLLIYDESSFRIKQDGTVKIRSNKDYELDIENDADITIKGATTVNIQGNASITVDGITDITCPGIYIEGDVFVTGTVNATEDVITGFGTEDAVSSKTHTHGGITVGIDHSLEPDPIE